MTNMKTRLGRIGIVSAGADHVALQVIQSEKVGDLEEARAGWRELAALL